MGGKATEKKTFDRTAQLPLVVVANEGGLCFRFFSNGALYDLRCGDTLINQILGNYLEPGLAQIRIRILPNKSRAIKSIPITGPGSTSAFSYQETTEKVPSGALRHTSADQLRWEGNEKHLRYTAELILHEKLSSWFWKVSVQNMGSSQLLVDIMASQDVGLASPWFVRLNEAYACHYIDAAVLIDPKINQVLCLRQNLAQGDGYPWLMMGCLDGSEGFLTDGFDLFGTRYKGGSPPLIAKHPKIESRIRQYEFAYPTLKSNVLSLAPSEKRHISFFGLFEKNHPEASSAKDLRKIRSLGKVRGAKPTLTARTSQPHSTNLFTTTYSFPAETLSEDDCLALFPGEHRHQEKKGRQLLSFFYNDSAHVILREKELLVERPHGHILRSGSTILQDDDLLSTTVFAAGVFGSQTTIGNTAYNKIISGNRNALFLVKSIGTRIFVHDESTKMVHLLDVPSAFEMGLGYARWIYKQADHLIEVYVWTSPKEPTCYVTVNSSKKLTYTLSYNLVLGSGEGETTGTITLHHELGGATITPERNEQLRQHYPSAKFCILAKNPAKVAALGTDTLLFDDQTARGLPFVVIRSRPSKTFSAALTGSLTGMAKVDTFFQERRSSWERFTRKAPPCYPVAALPVLSSSDHPSETDRINEIMPWFLHNGTLHLSAPRGLEQYTAAAWGTRDVCQGPVELLLPLRHFAEVREIILKTYSHQFLETGDWPQWFMFDRYHKIQAQDSHGDVIIWPLKALCEYIEGSNDFSVLDSQVPYTTIGDKTFTRTRYSILHHIERQIEAFHKACFAGTSLLKFGHGDWEDTLQPADSQWRDLLVSSWSVELLYQTLKRWATICGRHNLHDAANSTSRFIESVKQDFTHYLMKDGIVAGLLLMSDPNKYLLHPTDKMTGVQYRLLPMTRGIISEIFTLPEAQRHVGLIQKHLLFPDGVRLTNVPLTYNGGESKFFKRAETSAFFGREVGMMYIHAHLRYVEAMAKMGLADEAWQGLAVVNPVLLSQIVKRAELRQSNMYFSSSDANFLTRAEASQNFSDVRAGTIGLKGGWRLYSSGPGLFFKQLLQECLGIRDYFEYLVFDPVLPVSVGKVSISMEYERIKLKIIITPFCRNTSTTVPNMRINGRRIDEITEVPNPYRVGGAGIVRERFLEMLNRGKVNRIEIFP